MGFDIAAARQAGYSDDEIASYLASAPSASPGFNVNGALKAGYSPTDVLNYLTPAQPNLRDLEERNPRLSNPSGSPKYTDAQLQAIPGQMKDMLAQQSDADSVRQDTEAYTQQHPILGNLIAKPLAALDAGAEQGLHQLKAAFTSLLTPPEGPYDDASGMVLAGNHGGSPSPVATSMANYAESQRLAGDVAASAHGNSLAENIFATAGNAAPGLAAMAASGGAATPYVAAATFGLPAADQAYHNAINNGQPDSVAREHAAFSFGLNTILGSALGKGAGLAGDAAKSLLGKLGVNAAWDTAAGVLAKAGVGLGEGYAYDVSQKAGDRAIDQANDQQTVGNWSDIFKTDGVMPLFMAITHAAHAGMDYSSRLSAGSVVHDGPDAGSLVAGNGQPFSSEASAQDFMRANGLDQVSADGKALQAAPLQSGGFGIVPVDKGATPADIMSASNVDDAIKAAQASVPSVGSAAEQMIKTLGFDPRTTAEESKPDPVEAKRADDLATLQKVSGYKADALENWANAQDDLVQQHNDAGETALADAARDKAAQLRSNADDVRSAAEGAKIIYPEEFPDKASNAGPAISRDEATKLRDVLAANGVQAHFFMPGDSGDLGFKGFSQDGNHVFLDATNRDESLAAVAGHEVDHAIQNVAPDLHQPFADAVNRTLDAGKYLEYAKYLNWIPKADINAALKQGLSADQILDSGLKVSGHTMDDLRSELSADARGNRFVEPRAFWASVTNALTQKGIPVLQRLGSAISAMRSMGSKFHVDSLFGNLDEIRQAAADSQAAFVARGATAKTEPAFSPARVVDMSQHGPDYDLGNGIKLEAAKDRTVGAFEGDLHKDSLPLGHAAYLDEGNTVHDFRITDTNGDERTLGVLSAQVDPQGRIEAIHDLDINSKLRGQGIGTKVMDAITESRPEGVRVIDMVPSAREWWRSVGADHETTPTDNFIQNGLITRDAFLGSERGQRFRQEQGAISSGTVDERAQADGTEHREPPEGQVTRFSASRNDPDSIKDLLGKFIGAPGRAIESFINSRVGTAIVPMSGGADSAKFAATKFADQQRLARWQWNRFDEILTKNFTPAQLEKMWIAADQENDLRREGRASDTEGLNSLTKEEREPVEIMHAYGDMLIQRAKDAGMFKGTGVPYWAPRVAAMIDDQGTVDRVPSKEPSQFSKEARNLRTTASSLKGRKYLTTEEAEAAGKAAYGEDFQFVKNIRTMPMVMERLERAIAGRELVNQIKEMGRASGEDLISETGGDNYFTIDHPALKTVMPVTGWVKVDDLRSLSAKNYVVRDDGVYKLTETNPNIGDKLKSYRVNDNGSVEHLEPLEDKDGIPVMDRRPLYIRKDFEGPLRAVLTTESFPGYQTLMKLKSESMGVIMMSPMMHNMVEYGRSIPAFALYGNMADRAKNIASLGLYTYFNGNSLRQDPVFMREAIENGMVPIGGRGANVDINGIADPASIESGKGLLTKAVGKVLDLANMPDTAEAMRQGMDKVGKFWHETLLWNRVADLQAGLYQLAKTSLINKGLDDRTSGILAAHIANRYAGALPAESMGQRAREIANVVMFSRSFTLGNLGLMKDMINGLPPNRQAMVKAYAYEAAKAAGEQAPDAAADQVLSQAKSIARNKAIMAVGLDKALAVAGVAIAQSAIQGLKGDKTWQDILEGYKDRLGARFAYLRDHPLDMLTHPFDSFDLAKLGPQSANPQGKQDRVRLGNDSQDDTDYIRLPTGKVGEELTKWSDIDTAREMLGSKLSPQVKGAWEAMQGKDYFGNQLYDPRDNEIQKISKAAAHFAAAQINWDQIRATKRALQSGATNTDIARAALPWTGFTLSVERGGDLRNAELAAQRNFEARKGAALPEARDAIQNGDVDGARDILLSTGMNQREVARAIYGMQNPGRPLPESFQRQIYQHATDDERSMIEQARENQ